MILDNVNRVVAIRDLTPAGDSSRPLPNDLVLPLPDVALVGTTIVAGLWVNNDWPIILNLWVFSE